MGEDKQPGLPGEERDGARQLVAASGLAVARGYGQAGPFGGAAPGEAESFLALVHDYLRILRKHKWVIVCIALAFLAIGSVRTLLTTPLYTATVRLQIDSNVAKILDQGNVTPMETGNAEFLRTQYELLESRSIAERAASALRLADDPGFLASHEVSLTGLVRGLFARPSAGPAPAAEAAANRSGLERAAAGRILANRKVIPVAGSRLVDITYTDPVPARARDIVMGLADGFIGANLDKRFQANAYAKTFLEDQLKQAQARLQDSEKAVLDFGQKEQIIATTDTSSIAESNLAAANAALSGLVADRIRNEQLYKQVQSVDAATLPQFLTDSVVMGLRDRRNALVTEYQDKAATFKPSYPAMIQLGNQIKETDRQIAAAITTIKGSLKGAYEASLSQEAEMKRQIGTLRDEVLDLQKRGIQYNILKHEADSNRALYDGLLQRYKEVDVAGGVGANNVFIVDKAEIPGGPSSPQVTKDIAFSLLLGLVAGLGAAVLLERLDNTVTTLDEMERLTGIATLGVIPRLAAGRDMEAELGNGRSEVSEGYRTLCTSLHFATDNGLPRSLLFTSAQPGEGKSTSSLTVGRHFAAMGLRVLLIDGDLRKPSLHDKLGVANHKGLTNYLTGACSLAAAMQKTGTPKLVFMASGPLPPNAADLLASPRLLSLLTAGDEVFDLIIFDGPPIMGLADAQLLSNAVAATVFVVRSGHTSKHSIRAALKRLQFARSNVIGMVLTRYDARNDNYDHGYDYGYGYGYGHDDDAGDGSPASGNARLEGRPATEKVGP
jgi:succinoglycan biosynthesis transport protein ExoP